MKTTWGCLFAVGLAALAGHAWLAAQAASPPATTLPRSNDAAQLPPDLGSREHGQDWPYFLGPDHNARSRETGLLEQWPADLPIVWQCPLGTSYCAPAVSRGRLFRFGRYGDRNRLTCMESETGKELWRYEYPTDYEDLLGYNNGPRCSPIVDGERVYVMGAEGELHCLRTATGERVWRVDTAEEFHVVQNFFGVGSTPLLWGDLLITNIGGSPPDGPPNVYAAASRGGVRGAGSGVVAFDKFTGEVRYQLSDELAGYASPVPATIDGRPWCFVFARGGLLAFDPRTGQRDFHYPWRSKVLESVNASSPVVVGDQVLISECYGPGSSLLRVRPGGYEAVWADSPRRREKALQTHWCTPVYHEGYVYACSGRHSPDAELRCVEWKSGKVQWSKPNLLWSSLVLADGKLIVLSENGWLRLLRPNPNQYEVISQVLLQDEQGRPLLRRPAWANPVLAHGLLYVRGADRLVCLDLKAD